MCGNSRAFSSCTATHEHRQSDVREGPGCTKELSAKENAQVKTSAEAETGYRASFVALPTCGGRHATVVDEVSWGRGPPRIRSDQATRFCGAPRRRQSLLRVAVPGSAIATGVMCRLAPRPQRRPPLRYPHNVADQRGEPHRTAMGPPHQSPGRRSPPRRGAGLLEVRPTAPAGPTTKRTWPPTRRTGHHVVPELPDPQDLPPRPQWTDAFLAYWTTNRSSNGGTEAINGPIELHRRVACGSRNRTNYRLRMLLIVGALES